MKKTLTILSFLTITFFSLHVKAQDKDIIEPVRSYLTLLGGISSPLGNFASANYYNNNAGFAKKGPVFGFDGAIYVYKSLGIGYTLTYQDQGELSIADGQNIANGYTADFQKDLTTITTVDRYINLNFLVGPQYSYTYHKFILDARASVGVIKSISTPSFGIDFDNSTNTSQVINQFSSSALAFAYSGSIGLRWSFSDDWDLGIKTNYVDCSGIKIVYNNDPGTVGRFQTKQPITVLQTTLGMTLRF